MALLAAFIKTIKILLFTGAFGALCTSQPAGKDVDIESLKEHVKKMDASFQELKSHSQAQEQKYSAVLSSVLSKLTQTTEELSRSKNVSEELQEEVKRMKGELQSLREENNKTTEEEVEKMKAKLQSLRDTNNKTTEELKELKQYHNQSFFELKENLQNCSLSKSEVTLHEFNSRQTEVLVSLAEIVGEMNATGYIQLSGSKHSSQEGIGFEAVCDDTKNISAKGRIVFDKVNYNVGNGYNSATGYFTAPVSGTYLFWTNILFRGLNDAKVVFTIRKDNTIFVEAHGRTGAHLGTASATTIIYLEKGDHACVRSTKDVEVHDKGSSAGAVLIKYFL